MRQYLMLAAMAPLVMMLIACGGGDGGGNSQPNWGPEIVGPVFTASPVDISSINFVTGQGHMAPAPHTLPTPHVYLYWNFGTPISGLIPVYAPGPGTVTFVLNRGDTKIMVRASPALTWYMDHIILAPGIGLGSVLTPGMVIGTTSPLSGAVDLGLLDSTVIHPFIAPQRYGSDLLTAVSPWSRYTPALRAQFDALSSVVGTDKDGAVCFDVDGTAAGNWFLDGVPDTSDAYGDPANWPKQLAFARDEYDATRWRISVGGIIAPNANLWAIAAGEPEPTSITPTSGIQIIRLYANLTSTVADFPVGWLLVRMDGTGVISLQYIAIADFPIIQATDLPPANFTITPFLYRRSQGVSG